jgi:hypothetical protein
MFLDNRSSLHNLMRVSSDSWLIRKALAPRIFSTSRTTIVDVVGFDDAEFDDKAEMFGIFGVVFELLAYSVEGVFLEEARYCCVNAQVLAHCSSRRGSSRDGRRCQSRQPMHLLFAYRRFGSVDLFGLLNFDFMVIVAISLSDGWVL